MTPPGRQVADITRRARTTADDGSRAAIDDRGLARAHDTALALLVAEAGRMFAASLDVNETVRQIGELVVGWFADWCIVDLITRGRLTRVDVAAAADVDAETARELLSFPLDPERPSLIHDAISNRRPALVPHVTEQHLAEIAQSDRHHTVLRRMGMTSYVAVPLVARDRLVGNLLVATKRGELGRGEQRAVEEIAALAAVAIDNAQKYQQATNALDERADRLAIVAHDLRSPLSNIVLAAGLLQLRLREAGIDGLEGLIDTVNGSANYMARLINDLTDVARVESDGLSIVPEPVNAAALVRDVAAAFRSAADAAGIELESWVAPTAGSVLADGSRILQVLSNLVGNALKFTAPGGSVRITAEPAGPNVHFTVVDNGRGIAPEAVDRIFDAFWRDDERADHGLGLGLTIAKRIVELHGGHIGVKSAPGTGTRLHFTLPVSQPAMEKQTGATSRTTADPPRGEKGMG